MMGVNVNAFVENMRAKVQNTFSENWKTIQTWSPSQRRMLLIITLLVVVNVVLLAHISVPQAKVRNFYITSRDLI